ncbi:MAG: hypothetical protein H5U10_16220 [Desulfacinum sp.]|jgi:hypothetical protein|nr:hypothetical protein [Desulfacinum sp.]MBZ4658277.1 Histone methylation protein [Desulfacinum sp.]
MPMDLQEQRFHFLSDYFREEDQRRGVYAVTAVGEFVPSSLAHVCQGMGNFLRRYAPHRRWLFLDAGSGDGRLVVLLALVFGLRTVGVEYDEELHRRSLQNIRRISRVHPPPHAPQVLCGDFLDDALYATHGLRFADFHVIFNYANNHTLLAEKVARDGSEGAYFLLYSPRPTGERFSGLRCVDTWELGPTASVCRGPYLQVYRKV